MEILEILKWKNRQWSIESNYQTTVKSLLSHMKVYITIKHGANNLISQYNLRDFVNINKVDNTLSIYNFIIGYTKALPTPLPKIKTLTSLNKVVYYDLFNYGLNINKVHGILNPLDDNVNYRPDLEITLNKFINDINVLTNNVLYLVNSRVFFSEFVGNRLILKEAGAFVDKCDRNVYSVIDFTSIGGYTKVNFTDPNVLVTLNGIGDNDITFTIKFNYSIKGKLPALVINRKLFILTKNYKTISEYEIVVSIKLDDLVLMNDELQPINVNWVNSATLSNQGYELNSVDIHKCLSPNTSAILLLDDNDISVTDDILHKTGLPFKYTFYAKPYGLCYLDDGTLVDYKVTMTTYLGVEITTSHDKPKKKLSSTVPDSLLSIVGEDYLAGKSDTYECTIKTIFTI